MDDYTHRHMTSNPKLFPDADLPTVMAALKALHRQFPSYDAFLTTVLKVVDPEGCHAVTYEQLCLGIKKMNINLSYQALYTLMRNYDNGQWKLDVKAFFEDLKKI